MHLAYRCKNCKDMNIHTVKNEYSYSKDVEVAVLESAEWQTACQISFVFLKRRLCCLHTDICLQCVCQLVYGNNSCRNRPWPMCHRPLRLFLSSLGRVCNSYF
jgi:hypothetical protein